jgi:uncharacterized protein (TIGR03435 family)
MRPGGHVLESTSAAREERILKTRITSFMLKPAFTRVAVGMLAVAWMAFGQPVTAPSGTPPSFEVASIKPSGPLDPAAIMSGKAHVGMSADQARVDIGNANLMGLICTAYKVKPFQIVGNPEWLNAGMNADRFDILAKLPEGANKDQVPEMLQALLAERFKLTVHHEKRDTPVYALVVGKGGPKLKKAPPEPPAPAAAAASPGEPDDSAPSKPPPKGEISYGSGDNRVTMKQSGSGMVINTKETGAMRMSPGENGGWRLEADKMTMETFALMLSQYVDRPVVDLTELKDKYQVALELSMDTLMAVAKKMGMNAGITPGAAGSPTRPADAASEPSGSSLFNSVQQLGLKLDSRKLPYDILVIDHVERTPIEY